MQNENSYYSGHEAKQITLYQAQPDWWTITSYNERLYSLAIECIHAVYPKPVTKDGVRLLQYIGQSVTGHAGTIYIGEALQRGRPHWMMRISGECAGHSELLSKIYPEIARNLHKVTRLDVQLTRDIPPGWSQRTLFERVQQSRSTAGWIQSTNILVGELCTVYIGARSSERFARVYEKEVSGGKVLRLEWELKGAVAGAYAHSLSTGKITTSVAVMGLAQQYGIVMLEKAVSEILTGIGGAKPKIIRQEPRTEKWLRATVLPSIRRYAAQHDADEELLHEIVTAIMRGRDWQDCHL